MDRQIPAWSNTAQQYYREIGKHPNGKAHRFYLTDVERAAIANVIRLEGVWQEVEARWNDLKAEGIADTPSPTWDDSTLQIAKAVGKGLFHLVINPGEDLKDDWDVAVWIAGLRAYFPQIQINLPPELATKAKEASQEFIDVAKWEVEEERVRHLSEMRQLREYAATFEGKIRTNETLHDALDAYVVWLHQEHRDVDGDTTATGIKQGERAIRVKKHVKDMQLSDFGMDEIHALFDYWRKRPKQVNKQKTNGKPFSHSLCKHTITLIKHFLRWLHKEKSMPWKKPMDLDLSERVKIVKDTERKFRAETYTLNEVKTLWSYATLFERKLLLFSLNFGASISENSTLDWKHIEGDFVKRLRPKTKVYGEFKIWPLSAEAMGKRKTEGYILLNASGNPLHSFVKGKQSRQIKNAWNRLLLRVRKHQTEFKKMGFHGMRRTAIQFIRNESDGETAGVFACHGKPVPQDVQLGLYSNPVFTRVVEAQEKVWAKLSSFMTDLGTDITPRKFSPETIREVRKLKRQGIKTKLIAAKFNMSVNQVNRYAKKKNPARLKGGSKTEGLDSTQNTGQ